MYEQLRSAVRDLLSELRIDPQALEVMARGYSPDYPGAVDLSDRSCTNPNVKVQLSMVVAQKLLAAGVDETGAVDMLKEGHVKKGGVNRSPKSPKPLIKSGAQKPERVDENFTPIKYYPICDQCVAGNGESCNNPRCSYCWGRCPQEMPFSEFGVDLLEYEYKGRGRGFEYLTAKRPKKGMSMYKLQDKPDDSAKMENGTVFRPVATLKDEYGGISHIMVDDHCYVLVNRVLESDPPTFRSTHHWYPEAIEALRSLPLHPDSAIDAEITKDEFERGKKRNSNDAHTRL